jgi:hypothetical protein
LVSPISAPLFIARSGSRRVQQNGDVVAALVRDDDVGLAVALEIADRQGVGIPVGTKEQYTFKGSVSIAGK